MKRAIVLVTLSILVLAMGAFANQDKLYPLYPEMNKTVSKTQLEEPSNPWLDDLYTVTHNDGVAEYYLGSGAADDTFFITFKPLAACSVMSIEAQWYTAGNITAFVADYSAAARVEFPDGRAPERGTTDTSPIGALLTGLIPNAPTATQDWETYDVGDPFLMGDPGTLQPDLFGVGFIKGADVPNPLADDVSARGINYTYTWFGGPWTLPPNYDHVWGAYSSDFTGTVVEVNMRCWVSYEWGMPILIEDLTQLSDTYDWGGSYDIEVMLMDDNGITGDDQIELVYTVNDGPETRVDLTDVPPVGDDYYGATIAFTGGADGDVVKYWVETIDDEMLVNNAPEPPKSFMLTYPMCPNSDLLFVDDGLDPEEMNGWLEYFATNDLNPEIWATGDHKGIDESVANWGWDNIFVAAWGISHIPALDEYCVYASFLDNGGNLFFTDQDYFYGNGLPETGTFEAGDFAYDYFGLNDYTNDPLIADTSFFGEADDPIGGDFEDVAFWTDPVGNNWTDYFTTIGEPVFWGEDDDNLYGCRYDNGFKTVYLGFLAYWGCTIDGDSSYYHNNQQFATLIDNVVEWFGVANVEPYNVVTPTQYALNQNYPNPFNPTTNITFNLGTTEDVTLKVFNLMGQEVAELVNGKLNSGPHSVAFEAETLSSGIYYYKLEAGDFTETKKMILLK